MAIDPRALEVVSAREMGQIPISIGTSLALEGAFGILEDHPHSLQDAGRIERNLCGHSRFENSRSGL